MKQEMVADLIVMLRKLQFRQLTFRKYKNFNVLRVLFGVQKESFTGIRSKRPYKDFTFKKVALKEQDETPVTEFGLSPPPPTYTHISGNSGSCSGSLFIILLKAPFPSLKRHTFLIGKHPSVEQTQSMTIP